jgi:Arc/MetJ-type ribon-helix-helix transcriptional regulator
MKVHVTHRIQKYVEDRVRAGKFSSEPSAVQKAIAKMMFADGAVEMSVEEIHAAHDPSLPDHELILESMLRRRIPETAES